MGAHTTPEDRYEVVTRYQRSGLTQREFCEAEGLAIGTLRGWLHKKNWRLVEAPRFVEVTTSKRPEQVDAIELRLVYCPKFLAQTSEGIHAAALASSSCRRTSAGLR